MLYLSSARKQVQALRAVESYLGLEKLYVMGTNCADNGKREGLQTFLDNVSSSPSTVLHYEFMQDFEVGNTRGGGLCGPRTHSDFVLPVVVVAVVFPGPRFTSSTSPALISTRKSHTLVSLPTGSRELSPTLAEPASTTPMAWPI